MGSHALGGRRRPPQGEASRRPGAVSERFPGSMRRVTGRRAVAEAAPDLPRAQGQRPRPSRGSEGIGNRGGGQRRCTTLDGTASRGGEVVEDAAEDAGPGDEGDHALHTVAAGADEGIDLEDPADELGPSAPKGGQGRGHRGGRKRRRRGRSRGERLCLSGLPLGPQLSVHDVGVGAVVVHEVPSRIWNVGEETGEVEGVEGLGLLVVVVVAGQIRGGL